MGKYVLILLIAIVFALAIFVTLYAFFAGLWEFNPTDISWFNTKIGASAGIIAIITFIILMLWTMIDKEFIE